MGKFLSLFALLCVGQLDVLLVEAACPRIISRYQWGARIASVPSLSQTPTNIFIHHTVGGSCYDQTECSRQCRAIQNDHMNRRGFADIGYSFLIGEDGRIYEGRGWNKLGHHTGGRDHDSLGFAIIGTFTSRYPSWRATVAAQRLIGCAVATGKVTNSYRLRGHRDAPGTGTACPGNQLYNLIKYWPHYG